MRAVRWHGRGDVRLDDIPMPEPTAGEVLIRVEAAGICGTDVDEARHGPIVVPTTPHPVTGRTAPLTLGHEIVGTVVATKVPERLAVGARVAPWPIRPCGDCLDCRRGSENRCPRSGALGMSLDGGLADFVVAVADRCVQLGSAAGLERAVLVEPFAVALHGLHQVDVRTRRLAVVGIGNLGLCLVEAAVRLEAQEVYAVSHGADQRALAAAMGAIGIDPPDAIGLDVDVAFEAAGTSAAVQTSLETVRRGGEVVTMGGRGQATLPLHEFVSREIRLLGAVSHCFERDFVEAAAAIDTGELAGIARPAKLISMEGAQEALLEEARIKRIVLPGMAANDLPAGGTVDG